MADSPASGGLARLRRVLLGPAPPAPLALLNAAFFHLTGVAPGDGTGVKFFKKDSIADLSAGSLPAGRQAGVEGLPRLPRRYEISYWGEI
jgi:hypothetical protein